MAAITAAMVWECRPTNGSDNNGGGFKAGGTGTDYSQQNAAQYALTGLTTAAANAIILTTSASADMLNNTINITGGTNFLVGIYEITAVSVGVSITVNANCTTAAGAAGTANVGGALQTLAKLAANMVGSNKAFVKAEATINTTTGFTFTAASVTPSETVPHTHLIGYTTTRGDNGQVAVTATSGSSYNVILMSNAGWIVEGINVNCSSLTGVAGIYNANASGGTYLVVRNCKVSNHGTYGIVFRNYYITIHHCEVTGGSSGSVGIYNVNSGQQNFIYNCYVHDNVGIGISVSGSSNEVSHNVISNNSGSTNDGILITSGSANIFGNTIYKNGRHGILISTASQVSSLSIRNNIITDHTAGSAAGIKSSTAALRADPRYDGNFYYNNTSNRVNMDDTATNAVDNVSPYTNTLDVLLTASPYTNAAGNDFTLNNTAGGGASVRGKGYPGVGGTVYSGIPGLASSTGYLDGGVFQHADPASSSGGSIIGS